MKKVLTNWVTYGAIAAVLIIWWGGSLLLASLVLTFACMATWRTKAWKGAFLLIAVAALVLSFIIPPPQQRETVQQAKDDVRKNLQGTSDRFNFVADRGLRSKVGDFSHLLQQHPELKDDLERITYSCKSLVSWKTRLKKNLHFVTHIRLIGNKPSLFRRRLPMVLWF